jgi:hypothetical protein
MSVHRSPARPDYPGNYKEGELARSQPKPAPLGPAKSGRQPGTDHKLSHEGPEMHDDQKSHGAGTMSGYETHREHPSPGRGSWIHPQGSKENHRTDFVPGQKHKK